jgi:hypothetical protein
VAGEGRAQHLANGQDGWPRATAVQEDNLPCPRIRRASASQPIGGSIRGGIGRRPSFDLGNTAAAHSAKFIAPRKRANRGRGADC